jgi:hypothetical protein
MGVKLEGRETDHPPPSRAEVKNRGAIPPLPYTSSWHRVLLIKHRDSFAFYLFRCVSVFSCSSFLFTCLLLHLLSLRLLYIIRFCLPVEFFSFSFFFLFLHLQSLTCQIVLLVSVILLLLFITTPILFSSRCLLLRVG